MKLSPNDWSVVLELLAEVLEVPSPQREAWLGALRPDQRVLEPALRQLLGERRALEATNFLHALPALDPRGAWARGVTARQRIGPWTLERELGQGGMASVWAATRTDGAHQREVALKLPWLGPRANVIAERFVREGRILSTLAHPHIASVLDAGTDDGQPWLALELVDGRPITEWADSKHLGVRERVQLFLQVLGAVQHAHAQLVIHRDLKPANVLVDARGEVKLLDFGVAKLLGATGEANETSLTEAYGRALTPQYASPEQLAGRALGTSSDVYSLGVVLYELLTGRLPYAVKRTSLAAMEEAILGAHVVTPSSATLDKRVARALDGDLDTIVMKMLRVEPEQRYRSAEAVALDLERHLESVPIQARPRRLGYVIARAVARHRALVVAATVTIGVLLAGLGTTLWQAREARAQARRAEAARTFLENMLRGSDPRRASAKPRGGITARELLDLNADRIEATFSDDVDTQLELLGLVGEIYGHLGEGERSEQLLGRRQAIALRVHGPNHPIVIEGLLLDVWGSIDAQDFPAAMRVLDEAARRIQVAGLDESVVKAQWWLARGEALRATANGSGARLAAFEAATALYERLDPDNDELVASLANAGTVLLAEGRLEEARARYERALAVSARVRDPDASATSMLWGNLSLIQEGLGDADGVEQSLTEGLTLARSTVGENDPVYWTQAARQAEWVSSRGDRARANQLFDALLSHVPSTWERNTAHARVWEKRGVSLLEQGAPAEALTWLEKALPVFIERPYREFDLRRLRLELGAAADEAGKGTRARELLGLARAEYLEKDPPGDASALLARERWARFLLGAGELEAAHDEFRAVIAAAKAPCAALSLAWAGEARVALGRGDTQGALGNAERASQTLGTLKGVVPVRLQATIDLVRSDALASEARHDEARALATKALTVLERSDAPDSALRHHALVASTRSTWP